MKQAFLVDEEISIGQDELIVSKTDTKGRIIYANDVFCRVAEYSTAEVLGKPHNIIRHPDMPRAVFQLMWNTIKSGREIFAYVKNLSASGRYYWVSAHVTPSFDQEGRCIGYHSNRRKASQVAIEAVSGLYAKLRTLESQAGNSAVSLAKSVEFLESTLNDFGGSYDQFYWSLGE